MTQCHLHYLCGLVTCLTLLHTAQAQQRPYIGFVYPAGGQQGTTFRVTLGGQGLEGVNRAWVSGTGVQARVLEYNKVMNNQEIELLKEQLRELKNPPAKKSDDGLTNLIGRIEKVLREHVIRPANVSIANLVVVEVSMLRDATPGEREIRLGTTGGVSNPLFFHVGQLREVSAPPMITTPLQVLGKEEQSLRRRDREREATNAPGKASMMMTAMTMDGAGAPSELDDDEVDVVPPCTLNGQISSGTLDRFRFRATKGQRMVLSVQARSLIPYIADAVPGWFQPVLALYDARGKEVAYADDYRFKPDPVIMYEVPENGDYRVAIYDALYRGREDFVYRLTVGELPYVTSFFPPGGRTNTSVTVELKGWNLSRTRIANRIGDAVPGIHFFSASGANGMLSNRLPFAVDTLPECVEEEPNSMRKTAQKLNLPVIVNGRVSGPGRRDVFQFEGQAGQQVVAQVFARRLDSPLDSVLKLTDDAGKTLAINDDREDAGLGLNTHGADSCLRAGLPSNGVYYLYLDDAQHRGGEEYTYRLQVGPPQPDFALRVAPSSVSMRSNSTATLSVHAMRVDGFTGAIKVSLKDPPTGFECKGGMVTGTQDVVRITVKTSLAETQEPVNLTVIGVSTNGGRTIVHEAVPVEDRMQAFLWRHLVPAQNLKAFVFNPQQRPRTP
jgi:hypothetical protein